MGVLKPPGFPGTPVLTGKGFEAAGLPRHSAAPRDGAHPRTPARDPRKTAKIPLGWKCKFFIFPLAIRIEWCYDVKNEIEARTRRISGSRRAENGERANPPNSPFRRDRGVGPWVIPAGLSAALPRLRYRPLCDLPRRNVVREPAEARPLSFFCAPAAPPGDNRPGPASAEPLRTGRTRGSQQHSVSGGETL